MRKKGGSLYFAFLVCDESAKHEVTVYFRIRELGSTAIAGKNFDTTKNDIDVIHIKCYYKANLKKTFRNS